MHKAYVTLTANQEHPLLWTLSSLVSESMVCVRLRPHLSRNTGYPQDALYRHGDTVVLPYGHTADS